MDPKTPISLIPGVETASDEDREYIAVKSAKSGCGRYTVYTFTPKTSGNKPDDATFQKYPKLRELLPRGFSAVVRGEGREIVAMMQGPTKFEGVTNADNDDAADGEEYDITDTSVVAKWQSAGKLSVFALRKENGKYATVRGFYDAGEFRVVCGSKSVHRVFTLGELEAAVSTETNELSLGIYQCVLAAWDNLRSLFDSHPEHTLCGEFCDGMHFVPLEEGEEKNIRWFGLFKDGKAIHPLKALAAIRSFGLPSVHSEEWDPSTPVDEIILRARMGEGEGYVINFVNAETGDVMLAKNKTSLYILKRMLREKLKRGYHFNGVLFWQALVARICDASGYHCLSTEGAIYLHGVLTRFGKWMMRMGFPADSVSFQCKSEIPIKGFANLWKAFEDATGDSVRMTPEMFHGLFDAEEFKAAVQPPPRSTVPRVVFIQSVQGTGKTSVAEELAKLPGVASTEQDYFDGNTNACQAEVLRLMEDPDIHTVIVSRCNADPGEYGHYLQLAMRNFGNFGFAYFMAFQLLPDRDAQIADCMKYIRARSDGCAPGFVRLGVAILPEADAERIVGERFDKFEPRAGAYPVRIYDGDNNRLPIAAIVDSIKDEFLPRMDEFRVAPAQGDTEMVYAYVPATGKHATVFHVSNKGGGPDFRSPAHGARLNVTLTHHVEELGPDGAPTGFAAYRAALSDGVVVQTGKPHVTDKVPPGGKPAHSVTYVACDDPARVKVAPLAEPEVYDAFVIHIPKPYRPAKGKGKGQGQGQGQGKANKPAPPKKASDKPSEK